VCVCVCLCVCVCVCVCVWLYLYLNLCRYLALGNVSLCTHGYFTHAHIQTNTQTHTHTHTHKHTMTCCDELGSTPSIDTISSPTLMRPVSSAPPSGTRLYIYTFRNYGGWSIIAQLWSMLAIQSEMRSTTTRMPPSFSQEVLSAIFFDYSTC